MKTTHDDMTVGGLLQLKRRQMLVTNSEYQRGAVWTAAQKKKLVDSVLRGYGVGTRVNSDRADTIQRRHEFFTAKMYEVLNPLLKDPQRIFGTVERELIYYRNRKRCGVCDADVVWPEAEFHHVDQHSKGGQTVLENGALVHRHCHPKGQAATEAFAKKWQQRSSQQVP